MLSWDAVQHDCSRTNIEHLEIAVEMAKPLVAHYGNGDVRHLHQILLPIGLDNDSWE